MSILEILVVLLLINYSMMCWEKDAAERKANPPAPPKPAFKPDPDWLRKQALEKAASRAASRAAWLKVWSDLKNIGRPEPGSEKVWSSTGERYYNLHWNPNGKRGPKPPGEGWNVW